MPAKQGIKQKNVHDLVLVGRFDLNLKSAIHDPRFFSGKQPDRLRKTDWPKEQPRMQIT